MGMLNLGSLINLYRSISEIPITNPPKAPGPSLTECEKLVIRK